MSTLSEINFNYQRAVKQAGQLESVAGKLKKAAEQNMEGILNDVYRAWKSDNSGQYIKKGQKVEQDIKTCARNLTEIARAIRTIAERVRQAELEAWRIANERSH